MFDEGSEWALALSQTEMPALKHHLYSRQDKTRQDKTRQDKARQDK